jgi:sodium/proline symporter
LGIIESREIVVSISWNWALKLSSAIYEVLPGMATGSLVYGVAQFFTNDKETKWTID